MKRRVYYFLLSSIITVIFSAQCRSTAPNDVCNIYIINSKNARVLLKVEVADNNDRRQRGLMFRKEMKTDHGMLFVFEQEQTLTFWMRNTYLPLSIAYIGASGVINEIYHMKPLDDTILYPSLLPARYAIEVNKGWFDKNFISEGCRVEFNGCISK
jgi:uncharacterized membrane protein (UPF0127 family)